MKMELFKKIFNTGHWRTLNSGVMLMFSDLQLVYMVPRKSTQLLNINTTNFQVEREPVYEHRTIYRIGLLMQINPNTKLSIRKRWPHIDHIFLGEGASANFCPHPCRFACAHELIGLFLFNN